MDQRGGLDEILVRPPLLRELDRFAAHELGVLPAVERQRLLARLQQLLHSRRELGALRHDVLSVSMSGAHGCRRCLTRTSRGTCSVARSCASSIEKLTSLTGGC